MDIVNQYNYLKWLHIICFTGWIGCSIFYSLLLRYHTNQLQDNAGQGVLNPLIQLEKTLLRTVYNPLMLLTIVFGIWLAVITGVGAPNGAKWLHPKILLVLGLGFIHMQQAIARKKLSRGEIAKKSNTYTIFAVASFLCFIAISFLAVVKPF